MYGNDVVDPEEALNASETPEFDEAVAGGEAAEARNGESSFDALIAKDLRVEPRDEMPERTRHEPGGHTLIHPRGLYR